MIARFERSHCIHTILETTRAPKGYDKLRRVLSKHELEAALGEDRPFPMTWLWMEAKRPWSSA
jgi:hypothetical protein